MKWIFALAIALSLVPAAVCEPARAASFPDKAKPLRIVVPFAAGGSVDSAARLLGEQLHRQWGSPVVIENKAGASGTIGGMAVKNAPAVGYTLLFSAATHVLARHVLSSPPYDPATDFAPVARIGEAPLLLVVSPQRPQQRLSDILAAARQKPEKWTAAIPAAGAPGHLATLQLARQGGVGITPVAETPDQFRRFIAGEIAQGTEILQRAGFKPE